MKEIDRYTLDINEEGMPFDVHRDGKWYKATGDKVKFEGDSIYWMEYSDDEGELFYFN